MDTAAAQFLSCYWSPMPVAREKNIDREEVLEAMEQAISKAGRAKLRP